MVATDLQPIPPHLTAPGPNGGDRPLPLPLVARSAHGPPEGGPDAGHPTDSAAPLTGLRPWFIGYLIWMIGLTIVARTTLEYYADGSPWARTVCLLAYTCFYLSLCNIFMPLPTSVTILLVASADLGLGGGPAVRIGAVALCGALATTMANLNEYHILGYFFRARLGDRVRHTRAYHWSVKWFDITPFRMLAFVAFLPIPVDVVRWIAILRRYPRLRFAAAYFVGRTLRYALLSFLAIVLELTAWQIILIQIGLVVIMAVRLGWVLVQRTGRPADAAPAT